MSKFDQYVDILIEACRATIEQMSHLEVAKTDKRVVLKDNTPLPFAHIIKYKDEENKFNGEFILGFESISDALMLSSAVGERLGIGQFEAINEDSTDLLNEFINIVVGRTISEWDSIGLKAEFDIPVFKKDYQPAGSGHFQGYSIELETYLNTVDLEEKNPTDKIYLRVNFINKLENKLENKKILLVEDSKVMRSIIGKILKEKGVDIKEAKDGEEAVILHKTYKPDLTLMDINMPKLNGFDAISQIKKFAPDSKFIILSSSSKKDEIVNAKTLHVVGYLVKPVDPDKLLERVSAAL